MSAHSPIVPPTPPAPQKKRLGWGCFSTMTGAVLVTIAVLILLNPWALHIGGRWTPALTWHGIGKFHSTTGATYGLFIEVSPDMPHSGRHTAVGPRSNLRGAAKICTPQGDVYPLTVSGSLKKAWLDVEGKPVTFYFHSLKNADPKLNFELLGAWQGQELVLDDRGNMAMSFASDGRAKGYLKGTNSPAEVTSGKLHYATENEFNSVCEAKSGNTF
jgi:hypothetical protein